MTQLGAAYDDRYVLREGRWLIAESRSHRMNCVIQKVDSDGAEATIAMGEAPGAFGDKGDSRER